MARKKRAGSKKAKKSSAKKKKNAALKTHIVKSLYSAALLTFFVVTVGLFANYVLPPQESIQSTNSGDQRN